MGRACRCLWLQRISAVEHPRNGDNRRKVGQGDSDICYQVGSDMIVQEWEDFPVTSWRTPSRGALGSQ